MITYLAVDPGEHAGLALIGGPLRTEPRRLVSKSLTMPKRARDGLDLQPYLDALDGLDRPDHAAIEHPFPVYTDGKVRNLMAYETQLRAVVMWRLAIYTKWQIMAETPYPSEWIAVVLREVPGIGTRDKAAIFVKGKFGYVGKTHDEEAALCIDYWLVTKYGNPMKIEEQGDYRDRVRRATAAAFARKNPGPEVLQAFEDLDRAAIERRKNK